MEALSAKMKMIKFLIELKSLCEKKERFSSGELCSIHAIGRSIPTVMQNIGMLTNNRYGLWTWNYDGAIDADLVLKITDAVRIYQLECKNKKKKIDNQHLIPLTETERIGIIEMKIDKILKALAIT